jgi:predicted Zn-ribbon and HTH transcriptional regulator
LNKKFSYDFFKKELKNKNLSLISPYYNMNTIVKALCLKCGYIWNDKAYLVFYSKCPSCNLYLKNKDKKIIQKNFIKKVQNKHNNILPLENFISSSIKIKFLCIKCHNIWESKPNNTLTGKGCSSCKGGVSINHEEFIEKLKKINDNIEVLGTYKNSSTKIKVKCKKCFNIWEHVPQKLILGARCQVCKSKVKTKPEIKIEEFLIKNKIKYIYQKRFNKCRSIRGFLLKFDFYIPNHNLCIEYDGEGHYDTNFWLNNGKIDRTNDKIKEFFCAGEDIGLLRIPYWEKNNLNQILHEELLI